MTYTHASAVRNRYMEFTNSWAKLNKPSGLIVKLDANGKPPFSGGHTLSGLTIVDVTGWAPTADTLWFVKNPCTGEKFSNFTIKKGSDVYAEMVKSEAANTENFTKFPLTAL